MFFAVFTVFGKLDYRLYDMLLGKTRAIKEDSNILIIDIDDSSIDDIGVWPWSRDIAADMLVRMKEFNAVNIVFDIEYLQRSGKALVPSAQEETEETIERAKQELGTLIGQFADAAASGMYSPEELEGYSQQLRELYVNPALDEIKLATDSLSRDNDEYFARCLQFFGNSWLTLNADMMNELDGVDRLVVDDSTDSEKLVFIDSRRYTADNLLLSVQDSQNLIEQGNAAVARELGSNRGFYPTRSTFLRGSSGLGATNVVVDQDGTRRRIELLHHPDPAKKFLWLPDGKDYVATLLPVELYVPQLVFAPLLRYLDVQSVSREGRHLVLHGALLPEAEKRDDIRIPLDANGCMLINWSKQGYHRSFKHISALYLYELDRCEERIIKNLSNITRYKFQDEDGYDLSYYVRAERLLELHSHLRQQRAGLLARCQGYDSPGVAVNGGIGEDDYEAYFSLRQRFYDDLTDFMQASLLDEVLAVLEPYKDGEDAAEVQEIQDMYSEYFYGLRRDYDAFMSFYDELKEKMENAFCLIGNSATASTDLGVTPFERSYANLGTHANIANTILQQDFITPLPVGYGIALSFLCALVVILLARRKSTTHKNMFELLYVFIPLLVLVLLMLVFQIYIPLFVPMLLVILTYIAELAMNFIAVERDRNTLRRGMDAYVAPEVVNQIVKDPSKLRLGGVNKQLTALFSDVKTFSGFTEMINNEEGEARGAVRLVTILNEYLGKLSDAIMENRGTIDKYVGDEIVSFFGAPLDDSFNAYNACVAGIRMKQVEQEYNKKHFDTDHDIPMRLESRVGLNTGDMVVGNMGTVKKINYTIMGNNVNLASRLEGTNKVYGSWIMCSENTWLAANAGEKKDLLVARNFDCVQVVNVRKPVQLYNILGLRSEMPAAQLEAAEIFNEGISWYLKGRDTPDEAKDMEDLKRAFALFKQAYSCYPADLSSRVFMERCQYYAQNGLPARWDGVYVMKSK